MSRERFVDKQKKSCFQGLEQHDLLPLATLEMEKHSESAANENAPMKRNEFLAIKSSTFWLHWNSWERLEQAISPFPL